MENMDVFSPSSDEWNKSDFWWYQKASAQLCPAEPGLAGSAAGFIGGTADKEISCTVYCLF